MIGGLACAAAAPANAQSQAPRYEQCRLDAIYPAGGQAGTTVTVEFQGFEGGMQFPTSIVIDGPPGVTAVNLQPVDVNRITADLVIAVDAAPGRRAVRVASEQCGLTNLAWFCVGRLPECNETEPNNDAASAEAVTWPVTINGRIHPETDRDCFRFTGSAGDVITVGVQAAALDAHGQGQDWGLVDASLTLSDSAGRILGEAYDVIGLDPLLTATLSADGDYVVQVELRNYRGFPQAVYRCALTDGDIPLAAFPPGGARGETIAISLAGTSPLGATSKSVNLGTDAFPVQWVTSGSELDPGWDVPLLRIDGSQTIEVEPNDDLASAPSVSWPTTIWGRLEAGDADSFSIEAADTAPIRIETISQRHLRVPLDTLVEVFDAEGNELLSVDDGLPTAGYESFHLYRSPDTFAVFTPPAPGTYTVRVTDAAGQGGPRCVYALQLRPAAPDFEIVYFPDAVPIWGPGSTSAVLVKVERQCACVDDIELTVEGLPPGWISSRLVNSGANSQIVSNYKQKQFLTITAPADAIPGQVVEFQIVGRSRTSGAEEAAAADAATPVAHAADTPLVRTALPLSLLYTSDIGLFRGSPQGRAAVTRSQGLYLSCESESAAGRVGETITIPVKVHGNPIPESISLTANVASDGVACSLEAPQTVTIQDGIAAMPITLPSQLPPGEYGLVIAVTWRSDIRIGMPGPCTPLIQLTVNASE